MNCSDFITDLNPSQLRCVRIISNTGKKKVLLAVENDSQSESLESYKNSLNYHFRFGVNIGARQRIEYFVGYMWGMLLLFMI